MGDIKDPLLMDANHKGDFLALGFEDPSKYDGLFVRSRMDQEYYKVIAQLRLNALPYGMLSDGFTHRRVYNNTAVEIKAFGDLLKQPHEEFLLLDPGMVYRVRNYHGYVELLADIRRMYDFGDQGRHYEVSREQNITIVRYTKYAGGREENEDYRFYLGIYHPQETKTADEWIELHHPYDEARKDEPKSTWVYHPLSLLVDGEADILIAAGATETEVREKLDILYGHSYGLIAEKKYRLQEFYLSRLTDLYHKDLDTPVPFLQQLVGQKSAKAERRRLEELNAYIGAKRSLHMLLTDRGLNAGLPWFFQVWTRDEAISLGAFIQEGKHLLYAKNRLIDYLKALLPDGRIPNRVPSSMLGSADGVGWVFLRLGELLRVPAADLLFSMEEIGWIYFKLGEALQRLDRTYGYDPLIRNAPFETWMDTGPENDSREGFRLEIQALQLSMLDLACRLGDILGVQHDHAEAYARLRDAVRGIFFQGNLLMDGRGDPTIRPNVFLAYYIHKDILKPAEWEAVFDAALPHLWTGWGGLATIDKRSPLFCDRYTGSDNRSYHRGDSWFFVNNIAAWSLADCNAKKYRKRIEEVIEADVRQMLFSGVLGASSELSSASALAAEGCWNQAWSDATFIELMEKVR